MGKGEGGSRGGEKILWGVKESWKLESSKGGSLKGILEIRRQVLSQRGKRGVFKEEQYKWDKQRYQRVT